MHTLIDRHLHYYGTMNVLCALEEELTHFVCDENALVCQIYYVVFYSRMLAMLL